MAWTAEIIDKNQISDVFYITVRYTDGKSIIEESYKTNSNATSSWATDTITLKLKQLDSLDTADADIKLGAVVPNPDITDADMITFKRLLNRYSTFKKLMDYKIVSESNKEVADIKVALSGAYEIIKARL